MYADATVKLNFEKLNPTIFLYLSLQNDTAIYTENPKAYANDLSGVQVMAKINLQCNSLSQIHSNVFFRLKTV